jgi:hypothetical protein
MSGKTRRVAAETMLLELSDPARITGGLELASLLEAWGFVRGGRLDGDDPEIALFYIHPEHPYLHMSIPIGGPLPRTVMDYAFHLVRSVENRTSESTHE